MAITDRAWLRELLTGCPFGIALDSCPAREIRKLPVYERLKVLDGMSDDEVESILDYHKVCSTEREKLNM